MKEKMIDWYYYMKCGVLGNFYAYIVCNNILQVRYYVFFVLMTCESESFLVLSDSATAWIIQSMEFSRPEYWSGQPFPSPGDLSNPGIKPRSPALQVDSLPAEPQGKPKNTGVGSLSLFQGIFPTQELNRGLLHCRWILYQLSYLGSLKLSSKWLVLP